VEAAAVLAIVRDEPYPSAEELGAQVMSYLNGMGEAASEVRRFALDEMRHGRIDKAEAILAQMETIYEDLITFDYADSMTGGLRRTCDALRAVVERTRSDLTATTSQQELVRELRATREALTPEAPPPS
jgi:translin